MVEEHSIAVSDALAALVDLFDVPDSDRHSHLEDLRLLIDGICLGVCSGGLLPGGQSRRATASANGSALSGSTSR